MTYTQCTLLGIMQHFSNQFGSFSIVSFLRRINNYLLRISRAVTRPKLRPLSEPSSGNICARVYALVSVCVCVYVTLSFIPCSSMCVLI